PCRPQGQSRCCLDIEPWWNAPPVRRRFSATSPPRGTDRLSRTNRAPVPRPAAGQGSLVEETKPGRAGSDRLEDTRSRSYPGPPDTSLLGEDSLLVGEDLLLVGEDLVQLRL